MMKKLKIVIYLATQLIHGVGGTVVLDRSIGAICRNSRRRHCRARSAQWHACDLYRLFFSGSSWRKLADTKYDWYRLA
jgi:hypothetical protein